MSAVQKARVPRMRPLIVAGRLAWLVGGRGGGGSGWMAHAGSQASRRACGWVGGWGGTA